MRERKIWEANVLVGLAATLLAYGLFGYVRAVWTGGRPNLAALLWASLVLMVLCGYEFVLLARFSRVRFKGYPWVFMPGDERSRTRWVAIVLCVLSFCDVGLRFYQWRTGVQLVMLPDVWVSTSVPFAYFSVVKFIAYRRWLRSLA